MTSFAPSAPAMVSAIAKQKSSAASAPHPLPLASNRLPPVKSNFARDVEFSKRLHEAENKLRECPDRVPVILEPAENASIKLEQRKFLVPTSVTISQFMHIVRKRMKINPDQAIYLYTDDNTLPIMTQLMSQLYHNYAAHDRFLYLVYGNESTFGNEK